MLFLLLFAGLKHAEELLVSRFHRPEAGEQLIDEESLRNLDVCGVLDVLTDQSVFLFGGKRETENGLGEIISVDQVQLSLGQAMPGARSRRRGRSRR